MKVYLIPSNAKYDSLETEVLEQDQDRLTEAQLTETVDALIEWFYSGLTPDVVDEFFLRLGLNELVSFRALRHAAHEAWIRQKAQA